MEEEQDGIGLITVIVLYYSFVTMGETLGINPMLRQVGSYGLTGIGVKVVLIILWVLVYRSYRRLLIELDPDYDSEELETLENYCRRVVSSIIITSGTCLLISFVSLKIVDLLHLY